MSLARNFSFLLCFFILSASPSLTSAGVDTPALPTIAPHEFSGSEIFAQAKPSVFKLSTRVKSAHSEREHGSAFVVNLNGFLLTNFHVISDAVTHPLNYEIVLEDSPSESLAKVVAIDAVNDLALVKVDHPFSTHLELAKDSKLPAGTTLFSLGFPKDEALTMTQGTFNGLQMMGFSKVAMASIPLNPGMSGGPCLNPHGEVIGINRALRQDAQDISYFSPGEAAVRLLEHAMRDEANQAPGNPAVKVTPQISKQKSLEHPWREAILTQIQDQEKSVMEEMAHSPMASHKFGTAQFSLPLANLKCGQDDSQKSGEKSKSMFVCHAPSLALAGPTLPALEVQFLGSQASDEAFSSVFDVDQRVQDEYNHTIATFKDLLSTTETQPKLKEHCTANVVRNSASLEVSLRYCRVAVPNLNGLTSTFVKVGVLGGGNIRTRFGVIYRGMTLLTTSKLLATFIESIRVGARK